MPGDNDDDPRHGQTRRALPLANLIATLRHQSAARLGNARAANVDAWTRFLRARNDLESAMEDRERLRRRLENLDAILHAEEAHNARRTARLREIEDAETALAESRRRRREAERALERKEPPETKEREKKPDPAERIRQGHVMRQRLREECDAMVNEIRAAARASGTEGSPDVLREIENIQADFKKVIVADAFFYKDNRKSISAGTSSYEEETCPVTSEDEKMPSLPKQGRIDPVRAIHLINEYFDEVSDEQLYVDLTEWAPELIEHFCLSKPDRLSP